MIQEKVVFAVVFVAFATLAWRFFRGVVAGPLSEWLLKRGKVKWAMKMRAIHQPSRSRQDQSCH